MNRRERVYDYIKERSASCNKEAVQAGAGFTAQEIADALAILRNNASKELNELVREGRIVKFSGRPVRYFDRDAYARLMGERAGTPSEEAVLVRSAERAEEGQPFARLIGADGSLKHEVEQAKAAILYPPDGLHTLIVGQTGVGKTLFAHLMFEYGRLMKRFADDAPFVTFNCADYYNTPQLLISHVFGHAKGAFTGADTKKGGLVEAADGGVLFLDEIHRLPPEGQEMIFYFMDTGTYNRLGETRRDRRAKVLIIGATTEDPDSVLTKTFMRRIPNIIRIRPLVERTMKEKIEIIHLLFQDEVQRIKKPIRIGMECVKALVGSIGGGNVGQLKSNIKLLCAQAFLSCIDKPDYIEIDFKMLPQEIKDGLLTLSANRQALAELTEHLSDPFIIMPPGHRIELEEDGADKSHFNLYQVVEDKVDLLKGEGISSELIKQIVAADVNVYVKEIYNKKHSVNMTTRERLLKIVDASLVDFSEQVLLYVQKRMSRAYRDRFLYAFSLHLSAFFKRVKANETIPRAGFGAAVDQDALSMDVAREIGDLIEERFRVEVPRIEIEYIALLLESAEDDEMDDPIVIVVATHGTSTATSMVDVAQKLFSGSGTELLAVDMPLDVAPQDILEKVAAMLRARDCRRGVLVLADMGSLVSFGPALEERIKVPVRTLDMVSTPLVLEAMRKVDILGMDLTSIYESLQSFRGYEMVDAGSAPVHADEAIVTICSSGEGAAVKLKALVEDILQKAGRAVEVIPVGIAGMEERLREIAAKKRLLAAVGMKRPRFGVPFIPLEEMMGGAGERRLLELVGGAWRPHVQEKGDLVVRNLCEESLQRFLTYLNPAKVIGVLIDFDRILEAELSLSLSNPLRIRLIVHCGCALERTVTRSPLAYTVDPAALEAKKCAAVRKAARVFEETLKLSIAESELDFIATMV